MNASDAERLAQEVLANARYFLLEEYLPKIERCLETLSDEDVWWRPWEEANSVGNLMLHLAGNVRQWVVSGLGGAADTRDRAQEFSERSQISRAELLAVLGGAVREACETLVKLPTERLLERLTIQGRDVTGAHAVIRVVEHFSMHTGQIIYVAKLRAGKDLRFYAVSGGVAVKNW